MKKYIAYVGSYTYHGSSKGIAVYDVNEESGTFKKRCEIAQDNCEYLAVSPDGHFLYSVVDLGVNTFRILENGGLEPLGSASIRGMRGCFADIHPNGRFIAVAGFHDGKMTVLKIDKAGKVGDIVGEFYDKGIGSVAERNFSPHVSCVRFTPDGKFLCMVDSGIDQIRVFSFSDTTGEITLVDIIHAELNAAPHRIMFDGAGTHAYILNELGNYIAVYNYTVNAKGFPVFEFKQLVRTLSKNYSVPSAACAFTFSPDGTHLFCANAGENSISIFDIDPETGMLYVKTILPISGDYPKDIQIFPGGGYFVSVNNESNELTFFKIHYDTPAIVMNGRPLINDNPNCCVIVEY